MRRTRSRTLALAIATALVTGGGSAAFAATSPAASPPAPAAAVVVAQPGPNPGTTVTDLGATPAVFRIAQETKKNRNFRAAAWTTDDLQLTLMNIPVGGDVGLEMHGSIDQFLRIESGTARVMMGTAEDLTYVKNAGAGQAILIPSGSWHNIVNTSQTEPLKLYSLYGPHAHPQGTVHPTQADDPHSGEVKPNPTVAEATPIEPFTADPGEVPVVLDVEAATLANTNFRTAAWTADKLQLTLMSIPVGGDVGLEMHSHVDQFLRVEAGMGKVYFGGSEGTVRFAGVATKDTAILIPSGTWHNIVNASPKEPLKLYSLYGPQQHPKGTIHVTQADGEHH